jgi:hypothetical protein
MAAKGWNPLFCELVVYFGAAVAMSLPVVALQWAQAGYPFEIFYYLFLLFKIYHIFLNPFAQTRNKINFAGSSVARLNPNIQYKLQIFSTQFSMFFCLGIFLHNFIQSSDLNLLPPFSILMDNSTCECLC